MLKVDAVSLMMSVGIYLRLGFSSSHAYAYKVPVTFGLTLCFLLSLLGGVLYRQDRWIAYRQVAVRTFAALYIGMNAVYLYPRYAKEAFSFAWPWLLRYSNAWVLLMTAVGLMVRFHVHVPLQLINFAISAATLPSAICQAGPDNFANVAGAVNFACHNYWKEVVIIDNIDDNTQQHRRMQLVADYKSNPLFSKGLS
ncbi:hypothetical protein WJX79_009538 [Trebouxia sp. C0005]